ncbi:TetR family transcriptional regulator [Actinorhabdospora filicis]|uniref:TetR family transcriptional regulator n=1 Tax=Actinorhabdospora filicis TaxID=1785913 RepID=A0A9W6W176_9ACTN|nr:TetR family transcriptional regulator [Actinorhabdospora filicis]GLZ75592.1 TetR family transcriptional regulator [Actinorhabdospora filicis]
MDEELSLRERKKIQTGRTIWTTAVDLFLERGFDAVSVKEIAEAAEVSKMTVFNYFPTKEDLVVHPLAQHTDEPARVIGSRPPGTTPVEAWHAHFMRALAERDAATGLSDVPLVRKVQDLIRDTPALFQRALSFRQDGRRSLARALGEETGEVTARLMAEQILAVRDSLVEMNYLAMRAGTSADDRYPDAVADAELAFGLLRDGHGGLLRRA